ncbi:amidohydrolase family protein [Amaricoccus tamworthensis]|uniref:amidohydrolase family protein n=1 Tax=Amaricoccus tamworthensis TaxID=57002 RepID=UPI003C7E5832
MGANLLIRNATIVTMDAVCRIIRNGCLSVTDGVINRMGEAGDFEGLRADREIDAGGMILMPGLINTHCHSADSLFRGLVEDLLLEPWLQKVWKAEAAILNADTVRLGATLGMAELALGGVTTVMDMFWHPDQTVQAARDIGLRVSTGGIFFDGPGIDGLNHSDRMNAAEDFFQSVSGQNDVLPGTFPHGSYTVGPEHLKEAHGLAKAAGGLFCTHAAETRAEVADIQNRYGARVINHLDSLGVLDPRTVLAHCVWLDDDEIETLARTGVTVSHNPMSNLKLASGVARVPEMLEAGVCVTIGTDGAISGNDLDMWMALRLAATLHRGNTLSASAVTTEQALRMVTSEGAKALGVSDRLGSLEVGKQADMILVRVDRPHAVPMFDPMTHLVFSTAKSDVSHVFVGGKMVVENGELSEFDLTDTVAEVSGLAPDILRSIQ